MIPNVEAVTGGLDFTNYYKLMSAKVKSGLSDADAKKLGAVLGWGHRSSLRAWRTLVREKAFGFVAQTHG